MNESSTYDSSVSEQSSISQPNYALSLTSLNKVYRLKKRGMDIQALKDINLNIQRGSIFGLLGPNGAGKSTLINILSGIVIKTSGKVKVWDIDIDSHARAARAAIGVVPQELNLDAFFTPRELLELQAGLYGVPPNERRTLEILDRVGLSDRAETYSRDLSGGMRRRLLMAKALVHNPPVLVLDEPTAGVDIKLRKSLWDFVRELNAAGTTVLLTTHYLEEAEELCDRVAIINNGELIACDDTDKMVASLDSKELHISVAEDITDSILELRNFDVEVVGRHQLVFRYRTGQIDISRFIETLSKTGLTITDVTTVESDLEDVFLDITKE
ncbi:MAG: ABC transporter ATP-binding protein [Alphaproteobacteria bacterium]|nr:ABC transporter ATP-binding protein [Alphaproteobacteria bacterium]